MKNRGYYLSLLLLVFLSQLSISPLDLLQEIFLRLALVHVLVVYELDHILPVAAVRRDREAVVHQAVREVCPEVHNLIIIHDEL